MPGGGAEGLVASLLGGGVEGRFAGGACLLGGGVNDRFGGGVAALLGGGVAGLVGGAVAAFVGGGVKGRFAGGAAGFAAAGLGLPGAAAAGLFAGLGGGSFFAGGAGGAVLTRLDLAMVVFCPMGTTCGDGFILVTIGRFASVAGGLTDAVFAAAGTRFLGGATAVLSITWGC